MALRRSQGINSELRLDKLRAYGRDAWKHVGKHRGMRLSRIVVAGVRHFLQNHEDICTTPSGRKSVAQQKAACKARLEELIASHRPQLIGEEEKPGVGSVGKELADAHGLKYCPLSLPVEAREKAGVAKDYYIRRETRRAAYEIFESFMFDRIQQNRKDSTSILVICGSYHMERLAERFRAVGDEALTEDTYDAPWYKGVPIEGIVRFDKARPDV